MERHLVDRLRIVEQAHELRRRTAELGTPLLAMLVADAGILVGLLLPWLRPGYGPGADLDENGFAATPAVFVIVAVVVVLQAVVVGALFAAAGGREGPGAGLGTDDAASLVGAVVCIGGALAAPVTARDRRVRAAQPRLACRNSMVRLHAWPALAAS